MRGMLASLTLALTVGCVIACGWALPGDDMADDFCAVARCPGRCDETRRRCVEESPMDDERHALGDALVMAIAAMEIGAPLSVHAIEVLKGRPGDVIRLAELADLGDEHGLDAQAVAALFLALQAGPHASMHSVNFPAGRQTRVSVWFASPLPE